MSVTDVGKALYQFWSGFSIPAYPEQLVPDDAVLPYITYDVKAPYWRGASPYNARVWYKGTSMIPILSKVSEIDEEIGDGIRIAYGNGCLFLFKEDLFFQMQPSDDETIKIAYLSMSIQNFM